MAKISTNVDYNKNFHFYLQLQTIKYDTAERKQKISNIDKHFAE